MAGNGNLPSSTLAPIHQGRLRKDAAAAWNAMNAESQRRYGVTLRPLGGMSSYRTLSQQRHLYAITRRGWAAVPGTSNHGWGRAVDLATRRMRQIVDAIGAKYGWAKKWSDAQHEWWHLSWRAGVWVPKRKPDPLRGLSKTQRAAAERLLYHRREMAREKRTGEGPRFRKNLKWARFWKKRVQAQWRKAKGGQRSTLARVIKATGGHI